MNGEEMALRAKENQTVLLTKPEAESLLDWLECHLIDDIRSDEDVDNMGWLSNMMSIYNKCKLAGMEDSDG